MVAISTVTVLAKQDYDGHHHSVAYERTSGGSFPTSRSEPTTRRSRGCSRRGTSTTSSRAGSTRSRTSSMTWSMSLAGLTLQIPRLAAAFPTATPAPLDPTQPWTPRRGPRLRRTVGPPSSDLCCCGRRLPTRCCCWSAGWAHGDGPPACDSCCGGRRRPTRCCGGSTCRAGAAGPPRRLRPAGRCAGAAGHGHHHSTSQPGPARAPLFVHLLRRHVEPGALH